MASTRRGRSWFRKGISAILSRRMDYLSSKKKRSVLVRNLNPRTTKSTIYHHFNNFWNTKVLAIIFNFWDHKYYVRSCKVVFTSIKDATMVKDINHVIDDFDVTVESYPDAFKESDDIDLDLLLDGHKKKKSKASASQEKNKDSSKKSKASGSKGGKSKEVEVTLKTSPKTKQETSKSVNKSKVKTSQSGSKSNGPNKVEEPESAVKTPEKGGSKKRKK